MRASAGCSQGHFAHVLDAPGRPSCSGISSGARRGAGWSGRRCLLRAPPVSLRWSGLACWIGYEVFPSGGSRPLFLLRHGRGHRGLQLAARFVLAIRPRFAASRNCTWRCSASCGRSSPCGRRIPGHRHRRTSPPRPPDPAAAAHAGAVDHDRVGRPAARRFGTRYGRVASQQNFIMTVGPMAIARSTSPPEARRLSTSPFNTSVTNPLRPEEPSSVQTRARSGRAQPVLEDEQVGSPRAEDRHDLVPGIPEGPCDG